MEQVIAFKDTKGKLWLTQEEAITSNENIKYIEAHQECESAFNSLVWNSKRLTDVFYKQTSLQKDFYIALRQESATRELFKQLLNKIDNLPKSKL